MEVHREQAQGTEPNKDPNTELLLDQHQILAAFTEVLPALVYLMVALQGAHPVQVPYMETLVHLLTLLQE